MCAHPEHPTFQIALPASTFRHLRCAPLRWLGFQFGGRATYHFLAHGTLFSTYPFWYARPSVATVALQYKQWEFGTWHEIRSYVNPLCFGTLRT